MNIEGLNRSLKKCDIYLEDKIISKELILQSFLAFLSGEARKEENRGSIILHVGSPCFDAAAVVWAAFAVIWGNSTDVDGIVRSLLPGSPVLYERKRGEFRGIETDRNGKEWVVIRQDGSNIKKLGRKNWASIIPYQGSSNRYDGRGIRSGNGMREEFLAEILECDRKDIPGIMDASVIIVMDRHRAGRYMKDLTICCGSKKIPILDLVTASYFTEEREYPYGGNVGKNEAMLKFTSSVSVGLNMTYEWEGNRHLGMMVCGNNLIERGITEIPQVMNRENLNFAFLIGGMDFSRGEELISAYREAGVFACTKDFLLENTLPPRSRNEFTVELDRQAGAIIDREIRTEVLPCEISWQDYRDFKFAVRLIRQDELDKSEKADIVIPAWSLMKLFMTAPFSINELEKEIRDGKIVVDDPADRLEELERKIGLLPDNLKDVGNKIMEILMTMYYARSDTSPKMKYVRQYVKSRRRKKLAIIVPKAYYADMLWKYVLNDFDRDHSGIEIVSVNRFDGNRTYNGILVVGNIAGKHFDVLCCTAAAEITVLLYEPEAAVFRARKRKGAGRDKLFNARQSLSDPAIEEENTDEEQISEEEEVNRSDEEIIGYTEDVIQIKFEAVVHQESQDSSAPLADVSRLVRFEDGEGAMLTQYYKAYVLNDEKDEVEQRGIDDLNPGDNMVFLNRDNDTKDIVDYILNEIIHSNGAEPEMEKKYVMSRRWKDDLSAYMERTGKTPQRIAEEMIANGTGVQPGTIKNWLNEDTHTVGPQKPENLEQIALLTDDTEMFDHATDYFEACRYIRTVRKSILKELGAAIIRKLEGENVTGKLIPLEVQERLDTLAVILRIESIVKTDKTVPAYMTNRPLDLEGGI